MLEPLATNLPPASADGQSKADALALLEAHARTVQATEQRQARGAPVVPRSGPVGVPPRFADARLESWPASSPEQRRVLERVSDFAARFDEARKVGASLLLQGEIGAGKTTLACALCHAVASTKRSAVYVHQVAKLLRRIKEGCSPDASTPASEVIASMVEPDLLVLDELGVQHRTMAEVTWLGEILDDRYGEQKPTVIVTNEPTASLEELLGARGADRLREHGQTLRFTWPSFRSRKRAGGAS